MSNRSISSISIIGNAPEPIHGELNLRRCSGDDDRNTDIYIGWLSAPHGMMSACDDKDQIITAVRFEHAPGEIMLLKDEMATIDLHPDSDLGSTLSSMRFPGSDADDKFVSGGALILRATRELDRRGFPVFLVALVMQEAGPENNPAVIYEVRGKADSLEILESGRTMSETPNGMALSQIHKEPIWDINGAELSGPVSTMRLDIIDQCQRLEDLLEQGVDKNDEEYLRLNSGPAGMIARNISQDPSFETFRKEMISNGFKNSWNTFETESRSQSRSQKADEIIRRILSEATTS